jgi:WD40 repeat protein
MSADGSRLLVGDGSQLMGTSRSGMSVLWNMSIGKTAYAINESNGNIQNVGISRDGQRLLTMTSVPGAVIWDANTKQRLSILNNKQFGKDLTNNCASFSDDGQHVVTGSANGVVILWNASTGKALGAFDGRKFGWATDVAISPDGVACFRGLARRTIAPRRF